MVEFSKNKWKYSTIALAAILAVGFSFPEAFAAASTDSIMAVVKDIQAKVNSSVFGLSAIKTSVDSKASQQSVNSLQSSIESLEERMDELEATMPVRIITFEDLELTEANMPYEILPDDGTVHGIYVDLEVSDMTGSVLLNCESDSVSGSGSGFLEGQLTRDLGCDGLEFVAGPNCPSFDCAATINGTIRYSNEYVSFHDRVAELQ